jgi:hypothetical protein
MIDGTVLGLLYILAGIGGILLTCAGGVAIHYYCCKKRKNNTNQSSEVLINKNENYDYIDSFP